MASPNLSEIVTTTLRKRRGELADNVLNHNALLRRLRERGNAQPVDGGRTLVEELEYAENQTFKWYSGYELIDTTPSDVFTAAEYDWSQAAAFVQASGLEMRQNSGRERTIALFDRRIRNAEKTLMNNVSTGIYSDGAGSGGKQIAGLQSLVADDPSTGTVGGINRANFSFWRNEDYDANADGGAATSASNIQGYMNELWLNLVRGSDSPTMIVGDPTYFRFFWDSLQAIQRITTTERGASGFRSLEFIGPSGSAPVFHDDAVLAEHMYFLNEDYIFWRPHRDANFEPMPEQRSINQDAISVMVVLQAGLTLSNASLQGVLHDTT